MCKKGTTHALSKSGLLAFRYQRSSGAKKPWTPKSFGMLFIIQKANYLTLFTFFSSYKKLAFLANMCLLTIHDKKYAPRSDYDKSITLTFNILNG